MLKVSILMYHQVGVFDRPKSHRATFCHLRRFRAQMAYLKWFKHKVLNLGEAIQALCSPFKSGELQHAIVLTFDDGYQNFADHAFPVLERYGYPATIFLVSGLLGKKAQWLADDGREAPKLMDLNTILELRNFNIAFGSHTMTHPRLNELDPPVLEQEIKESKSLLESLLGQEIQYFCYPSGIYNEAVVAKVREAGYKAALTCDRGAVTRADDLLLLPRKTISFGDTLIGYFWKLHMKHKKKLQSSSIS